MQLRSLAGSSFRMVMTASPSALNSYAHPQQAFGDRERKAFRLNLYRFENRDSFHAEFAASAAERIRVPAEVAGGFRLIAAGFADYSFSVIGEVVDDSTARFPSYLSFLGLNPRKAAKIFSASLP